MSMLYTIVPHEEIFAEEHEPELVEVVRGEMRLVVSPMSTGEAQVVRVISSNPNDYLLSNYQPGQTIKLIASDLEGFGGEEVQEP